MFLALSPCTEWCLSPSQVDSAGSGDRKAEEVTLLSHPAPGNCDQISRDGSAQPPFGE